MLEPTSPLRQYNAEQPQRRHTVNVNEQNEKRYRPMSFEALYELCGKIPVGAYVTIERAVGSNFSGWIVGDVKQYLSRSEAAPNWVYLQLQTQEPVTKDRRAETFFFNLDHLAYVSWQQP